VEKDQRTLLKTLHGAGLVGAVKSIAAGGGNDLLLNKSGPAHSTICQRSTPFAQQMTDADLPQLEGIQLGIVPVINSRCHTRRDGISDNTPIPSF
jgi:hypothetical protein